MRTFARRSLQMNVAVSEMLFTKSMKRNSGLTGGVRMAQVIDDGKIKFKGGQCIDLYNQQVHDGEFVSMTTRIDTSNLYFVTQVVEND